MFGTYRILLSLLVVTGHLAGANGLGAYAVFGFYILSGYLMTLIMHQNYGYTMDGVRKYALNRLLRIFPIYWVSIIVSLALILIAGENFTSEFHNQIHFPQGLEWFMNLFLFIVLPGSQMARLTPPAWTLTVELFFYVCIGLGLSKRKKIVLWWFIVSVLYHLMVNLLGSSPSYKYSLVPAASLPFSTGALIYHFRSELEMVYSKASKRLWRFAGLFGPHVLFIMIVLNWIIGYLTHELMGFFYYSNFALNAAMLITLKERDGLAFISRKFDSWMGDFSYPVYLIHVQVGLAIAIFFGSFGLTLKSQDPLLFLMAVPVIFVGAWLLTIVVERPVESIRERVKKLTKQPAQKLPAAAAAELTD